MSAWSEALLAKKPEAFLRLGETSGTSAADASGNAHTGTYVNTPTLNQEGAVTGSGDADKAVKFTRSESERVTIPDHANLRGFTALTVLAWFKPVAGIESGQAYTIGAMGPGAGHFCWGLEYFRNGANYFMAWGLDPGTTPQYGECKLPGALSAAWHMVVFQFDGTNKKVNIFIDGAQVGSGESSGTVATLNNSAGFTMTIGAWGEVDYANASIDEFAVIRSVLSKAEIEALYKAGTESAEEKHSGTSKVSGGGSVAALGSATRRGAATVSGNGSVVAQGGAARAGVASLTGGGIAGASGAKIASGASGASGGGTVAASGEKAGSGADLIFGGGDSSASGAAARSGLASVSGNGEATGQGEKQGSGISVVSGGGSVNSPGGPGGGGSSTVSGGGGASATGQKDVTSSVSVSVSGGGDAATTGTKAGSGTSSASGGGGVVALGISTAVGSSVVSGGGSSGASGTKGAASGSSTTGGGGPASSGSAGRAGRSTTTGGGTLAVIATTARVGEALVTGGGLVTSSGGGGVPSGPSEVTLNLSVAAVTTLELSVQPVTELALSASPVTTLDLEVGPE